MGPSAGGGYELALACDEIAMVDDRSSTVSLPEVPLLAVLPGTGGLTRLTDKRRVRRDLADVFCTTIEGVRADRALAWGLVDRVAKPKEFVAAIRLRAQELARSSDRSPGATGVELPPLQRTHHRRWVALPASLRRPRSAGANRDADPARAGDAGPGIDRRDRGGGRRVVAARRGARTRRCDPAAAYQ